MNKRTQITFLTVAFLAATVMLAGCSSMRKSKPVDDVGGLPQIASFADDIKDIYGEAKSQGFDKKTLREMIRLRKMSKEERDEREALRDLYGTSLGVFG